MKISEALEVANDIRNGCRNVGEADAIVALADAIESLCPTGTVAVVVYVETVGFTDGVHLFSSVDDAERWMLQEIRQHGGDQSHLTLDEFQKRLKPNEDFWIVDVHDRRR